MNLGRLFCGLPVHCRALLISQSWLAFGIRSHVSARLGYSKNPVILSLVDKRVARLVVGILKEKVCTDPVPLMISNPGPADVIEELLKANFSNLFVYEGRELYCSDIRRVLQRYGLQGRLHNTSIYHMFTPEVFADSKRCLPVFPERKWNEEGPSFRIFGAHADFLYCLKLLLRVIVVAQSCNLGRPEMIICVPKKYWNRASEALKSVGLNPAGFLYPIGFNVEPLCYLPRRAFRPMKLPGKTQHKSVVEKEEEIAVLSIVPVRHFFSIVSPDNLPKLLFLSHQYMTGFAKLKFVIPELEKWIPGCGRELVLAGMHVTDPFWSLSCEKYLTVFNTFISHPDFKSSTFLADMEECMFKENLARILKTREF